jgi:SAM-dependent methyltransferase
MKLSERKFVEKTYDESWWTHKDQLLEFVQGYGGNIKEGNPSSFLGLDHLNGGVDDLGPIVEFIKSNNQTHLLDIGSGLGGPARLLSKLLNVKVTGIDISAKQIESASYLSKIL